MPTEPIDTTISRRAFLKAGVGASAIVTLGEAVRPGLLAAEGPAPAPSWIDTPMRWAQLTLVEDDPGKFDLAFWIDYSKRTRAVRLLAAGRPAKVVRAGTSLIATVPSALDHEVVAIDLASTWSHVNQARGGDSRDVEVPLDLLE
jgi:hypothetical protein